MIERRALFGLGALLSAVWPFRASVAAIAPAIDRNKVVYTFEYDCTTGAYTNIEVINRGVPEKGGVTLADLESFALSILDAKSKRQGRQTYFVIEVPSDWADAQCVVPVALSRTKRLLSSTRTALAGDFSKRSWERYLEDRPEVGPVDMKDSLARRDAAQRWREAENVQLRKSS